MVSVSTLIPVFNGAKYIRGAVESALSQSGVSSEVIVIDDGSTDETPQILTQFGAAIRVVRQANAGHVRARNEGAKAAKGEWLAFLDADDEWSPDKLARQLARAEPATDMIYTERENFGEIERVTPRQSAIDDLPEGELFEPLLIRGNFVTVSSVIMRKEVFSYLGGFDERLRVCEDWDLWLRFSGQGGQIGVVREPLTRYRWHAASMSGNLTTMLEGRLKVVRRAFALPAAQRLGRVATNRALSNVWATSAWYATPSQRGLALKWYARAAWLNPRDVSLYRSFFRCWLASR